MFKYDEVYRQGEILIFKLPKGTDLTRYGRKAQLIPNGVIREGEKEGHEHKVEGNGQLSMFDTEDGVIDVKKNAKITHPEHKPLDLKKGKYVVKTQKEAKGKHGKQSVKD